jgi:hypothetical protein
LDDDKGGEAQAEAAKASADQLKDLDETGSGL